LDGYEDLAEVGAYPTYTFVAPGVRDNRYSPHCGIAVDPFHTDVSEANKYPNANLDGYYDFSLFAASTQISFKDVWFKNFVVGIGVSLAGSGTLQNAENFRFTDLVFENCKVGLAICQSQSRNLIVENINALKVKTVISTIEYGGRNGDCPRIDGGNIKYVQDIFKV